MQQLFLIAVAAAMVAVAMAGNPAGIISYGHEIPTTNAFTYESRTLHPVAAPFAARGFGLGPMAGAYGWGPASYGMGWGRAGYGMGLGPAAYGMGWGRAGLSPYAGAWGGWGGAPFMARDFGVAPFGLRAAYMGDYGKYIKK